MSAGPLAESSTIDPTDSTVYTVASHLANIIQLTHGALYA